MAYIVKHGTWDLLIRTIRVANVVLPGLHVAELGNQQVYPDVFGSKFPAKRLWERFGCEHVSFDINGRDGALPIDLGLPLPSRYRERFDLVTNIGCAEHVETSQYWCWRNVHELAKPGGLMIHACPEVGSWPKHCKIRYSAEWLMSLATTCGYKVLFADTSGKGRWHLLRAIFRKLDGVFPDQQQFNQLPGAAIP